MTELIREVEVWLLVAVWAFGAACGVLWGFIAWIIEKRWHK